MHRVDDATAADVLPVAEPVGPKPNKFFANNTILQRDFMNALQEEVCGIVEEEGIVLDKTKRDQLLAALDSRFPRLETVGNPVGHFYAHEAATPDMTILIDAGRVVFGGVLATQPQQTSALFVAPVTNPRVDRIVIDEATGAASIVQGIEAVTPVAPDIPPGKLHNCQIQLETTTTEITNNVIEMIVDERTTAHQHDHGPSFKAYITASYSTAAGERFAFDGVDENNGGRYNNTAASVDGIPAYSFKPNIAGWYEVSFLVTLRSSITFSAWASLNSQWGTNLNARIYNEHTSALNWYTYQTTELRYFNGSTDSVNAYFVNPINDIAIATDFSNNRSTWFRARRIPGL